jgi:hypothetical protein
MSTLPKQKTRSRPEPLIEFARNEVGGAGLTVRKSGRTSSRSASDLAARELAELSERLQAALRQSI